MQNKEFPFQHCTLTKFSCCSLNFLQSKKKFAQKIRENVGVDFSFPSFRAEQVEEVTASLNSEDVFVLETPAKTFIWTGQASIEEELNIAKGIIELISPNRDLEVITEGSEPDDFWDTLGGKGDYSRAAVNFDKPLLEPRLFHCKEMSNGSLRALEINHFEKGVSSG